MKKIAISQRVIVPEKGARRDALEQDYVEYYEQRGATLLPIPNVARNISERLQLLGVDGVILSGGNDVNPTLYGETPSTSSTHADERDRTDRELLEAAIKLGLPVLAECRGCQFLNVFFGGKLKSTPNHVVPLHDIELLPAASELEISGTVAVNSFHGFGFSQSELSTQLEPLARAADGVIEAVRHERLPIAGIMWHPERSSPEGALNAKLVEAFLSRTAFWKKPAR
ncbi:MAG: type 1 glutamine amidotransferase [Bdellovibrionota bacterium]